MAKIEKLEEKRKGDKLTAHIGLAAEKKTEPVGECLTPDGLADVATNHCSPEQRKAALAHFASCQKCYNSWVAISFSIAAVHRGEPQPRRSLGSLRNLTYLGSAFAVAASVVVFLNVRDVPLERQMSAPQAESDKRAESVISQQSTGRARIENDQVQRKSTPSAPQPAVQELKAESSFSRLAPSTVSDREAGGGLLKNRADTVAEMAIESESVEENPVADSGVQLDETLDRARWLVNVEEACARSVKSGEGGVDWSILVQQGEVLLAEIEDLQDRQQIKKVLELLVAGRSPAEEVEQCRRIRALLAEGGN
jgi:hypothetical protein